MASSRPPRRRAGSSAPSSAAISSIAESEAWYRAVFDQAAVGIARVAPDGRFLEVNDRFCAIVGRTRAALMAGDFQGITHPDDLEADLAFVSALLAGNASSYLMEKRYLRPDGAVVWVSLHVALLRDAAGNPTTFVSVVEDISKTKAAEEMLKAYSHRLETLSRRLLAVQEDERRALARDLHDQVGQQLAGLKLNLEALRVRYAALAAELRFTDSLDIIDQTIGQISDTALDLRPSMLDDLGIVAALRSYARRQQLRSGCAISVESDLAERLPDHVETSAFRIVQEAVTNAIRHGHASSVIVRLALDAGGLRVTVRDDGRGFHAGADATTRSSGMGLLSMRERVELLEGEFRVETTIGRGTVVHARLPLA
ncbi:MAG: PAS domain S-box protein [Deltaproteobacteria bacterium]|nr:PAS domain S-box protein [Deltaproteobacteria bacterium]